MGRAIPCLIRIVAACPRLRLIRVCASYTKTFPEHEAFILIQPRRRDPCSQDWPGYAASERPFWMPLAAPPDDRPVRPTIRRRPGRRTLGPGPRPRPARHHGTFPRRSCSPNPLGKRTAGPGQANAPLAPGRSVRPSGPTVRSGQPRRRHKRALQGLRRSAPDPRSHSPQCRPRRAPPSPAKGCHGGRPPGPSAKAMNPGAR